ncbi:MAG: hypothetical protein H0W25_12690, partial [Acidimicrobiia bacterium]|nr:hypothetical protein [Acidimicrobiia bacterium]
MVRPPLLPIPPADRLTAPVAAALRAVPGSEALVFAASAGGGAEGTASPFVDRLRAAWGEART